MTITAGHIPSLDRDSIEIAIIALRKADPVLGKLIRRVGKCTLEIDAELPPYASLFRSIVFQQLNGKAAATILGRVQALFGGVTPEPALLLAMDEEKLRGAGLSRNKLLAVRDLASKTIEGLVPDHERITAMPDEAIVEHLTAIRGIGRWTVEMMLMFRLGRADVLPIDDYGVRRGFQLAFGLDEMPAKRVLKEHGARWAPHRTVASWYLWRASELAW